MKAYRILGALVASFALSMTVQAEEIAVEAAVSAEVVEGSQQEGATGEVVVTQDAEAEVATATEVEAELVKGQAQTSSKKKKKDGAQAQTQAQTQTQAKAKAKK